MAEQAVKDPATAKIKTKAHIAEDVIKINVAKQIFGSKVRHPGKTSLIANFLNFELVKITNDITFCKKILILS